MPHTSPNPCTAALDNPCTESKLLALHTTNLCLLRTLMLTNPQYRTNFHSELVQARTWLAATGHNHNLQAFDALLPNLRGM